MRLILVAVISFLMLAGCSGKAVDAKKTGAKSDAGLAAGSSKVLNRKHPLAKYIELVGFRLAEPQAGKLRIKLGVVNHSEADLGNLEMKVTLVAVTAKEGDEPIGTFDLKVSGVGPEEYKEVVVPIKTKLRVYELPDWQFLRAEFEILSPEN
ncbi:MAG: hypothetical protein ABI823_21650 [Bryobacteraceae bacterium]